MPASLPSYQSFKNESEIDNVLAIIRKSTNSVSEKLSKIEKLKTLIIRKGASTLIEIDGGVTNKNAKQLVEAGADVLVAGSFVFKAENPISTILDLKSLTPADLIAPLLFVHYKLLMVSIIRLLA